MATDAQQNDVRLDDQPTDESLMLNYKEFGSAQSLEMLIYRHEQRLFSALMSSGVVDEQEAEEIFKDTWLRVKNMKDSFDEGMRFKGWLGQIAYARASIFIALRSKRQSEANGNQQ